jgi:hypothetical protein
MTGTEAALFAGIGGAVTWWTVEDGTVFPFG